MKNITLNAPEDSIEKARRRAKLEGKSLNEAFRKWLDSYASSSRARVDAEAWFKETDKLGVNAGRKFTREEMNERR